MNSPVIIKKIKQIVLDHIEDENFGVSELASEIGLSNAQLLRKIKTDTGKTITEFIKEIRLKEAYKLLRETDLTASEVSYRVGFGSPSYFNKCFHEFFGCTPGNCDYTKAEVKENDKEIFSDTGTKKKYWFCIVPVLLLILSFSFFTINRQVKKKNAVKLSVAVLPFKNFSNNEENQYFADGVMEDIIEHLSAIEGLRVISRTTMESYRNTKKTIPEIARELKVSYIIESSIQKYGDTVRLAIQLIDAKKDIHIWSKSFKREFKNIFALEGEIAMQIAKELNTTLSPSEIKQINKKSTENLEAYRLYLEGRFFWHQRTKKDLEKSLNYFHRALELDSTYALAYAGLADAHLIMEYWNWKFQDENYSRAKELARKAISLDTNLAEAHAILGELLSFTEWNWKAGEKEIKLAISLNPNSSTAHQYYAEMLTILGRNKDAREQIDMAIRLNPYNCVMYNISSGLNYISSNYINSLKDLDKALELANDPNVIWGMKVRKVKCYIKLNENKKAVELIKEIVSTDPSSKDNLFLNEIYKEKGIKNVIKYLINWMELNKSDAFVSIASLYAFIDDAENSMKYILKMTEADKFYMPSIANNSDFDFIKTDPQFIDLLEKMNLADLE